MSISNKVLSSGILVVLTALLYGQFVWNPLVFDDLPFFMVDAAWHQPVDEYRFSFLELRSLPYATLAWSKTLFGLDLIYFRIENLLLHAAVAVSLFLFLSKLFGLLLKPQPTQNLSADFWAFAAAMFFIFHPVAVYAAGYLVQRTILMATLFSLMAMLAWLSGVQRNSRLWLWASVSFYYLAVFSKEHAIMLPAILLCLTILLQEDWKLICRRNWQVITAMVAVAGFVLISKLGIIGQVYEVGAPEMLADAGGELNYPLSVLTQSLLFFKYAALWLFPNPNWMSVDMREPFAVSLWSGYLAAFFAFMAWGVLSLWLLFKRGRLGLLGFALLFPWLMFMPEFSTVRIQESFVLYRSYLWAVGACAILPLLIDKLDKSLVIVLVMAVALALVPISLDRLATFSQPLTLWDDAAKKLTDDSLPGSARIFNNRGLEYLKLQYYAEALEDFQHSIRLNPNMPSAYTNMGATYLEVGQMALAISAFDTAIDIIQRSGKDLSANPFYGKGKAYEALGQTDEAMANYAISCKLANKGCEKLGGSESSDLSTKSLPGTKAAH